MISMTAFVDDTDTNTIEILPQCQYPAPSFPTFRGITILKNHFTEAELKEQIKNRYNPTDYLKRVPGDNHHFICPFCGSGTHEHGTPALSYYSDTKLVYCHSCTKTADVIGVVMQVNGLKYYEVLDIFAKDMGVTYSKKTDDRFVYVYDWDNNIRDPENDAIIITASEREGLSNDDELRRCAEYYENKRATCAFSDDSGQTVNNTPDSTKTAQNANLGDLDGSAGNESTSNPDAPTDIDPEVAPPSDDVHVDVEPPTNASNVSDVQNVSQSTTEQQASEVQKTQTVQQVSDATSTVSTPHVSEVSADYRRYFTWCRNVIQNYHGGAEYLNSRGIRLETALKHGVGFDPGADPANNPGGSGRSLYPTQRLIVPISPGQYVTRATTEGKYNKLNSSSGSVGLFNPEALVRGDGDLVFIVEGFFDALSLEECGYRAVATNSATNLDTLVNAIRANQIKGTIVISFDNDDAGKKATKQLSDQLEQLDVQFEVADISSPYKDPNEHFYKSKDTFLSAIENAKRLTAERPDNVSYYIDNIMGHDIQKFRKCVKTGFDELDRKLGGGLYAGLYVVGAVSSLGKTTLVHQIADQVATNGNDVLFFSLEQSRLELVSKSIARTMYKQNPSTAQTSLSIRRGFISDAVVKASNQYKTEVGNRFSIKESTFAYTVADIIMDTKTYIRKTNVKPIIVIDYLQIIQPMPTKYGRPTATETIDIALSELERFSKSMGLTIVVISSINRQNYLVPVDFESFKQSGGIEYTADCVLGIQLTCMNETLFNEQGKIKEKRERVRACKGANPRRVEIIGLKNRAGRPDFECSFLYHPANEYFEVEPDDYVEV